MGGALRQRLRGALREPATYLSNPAQARAHYALRVHALERISQALQQAGLTAMLVKGAAMALSVYPKPWHREMGDIDLLVRPDDLASAVAVLEQLGGERVSYEGRRFSGKMVAEREFVLPMGKMAWSVDLHTRMDKLVGRPIPYTALFGRGEPVPELPGLLVPCVEDHALLLVVHCAASEFDHPVAWLDLALLLKGGLDLETLASRSRQWRLNTALYVALLTLCELDMATVPAAFLDRLQPGKLRAWVLARCYRVGEFPLLQRGKQLGWRWVARQFPLRDDSVRWLSGVARYTAARVLDRVLV